MSTHTLAAPQAPVLWPGREAFVPAQPAPLRSSRAATSDAPREFSAFLVVGVVATAVSASLYNLFAHTGALGEAAVTQQPMVAFMLANVVGMVVSFAGTRWWVFRDRHASGPAGGLLGFVVINVLSWAVPLASLTFSRYVLGLSSALADNLAVNVIGLGLGTVFRFWALRSSTFADRPAAV
jgi:putative flippase GtrA